MSNGGLEFGKGAWSFSWVGVLIGGEVDDDVAAVGIDTGDTRDRLDAARKPATGDEHDHVDRLGDQPSRHGGDGFLAELLEPIECGRRALGVDGGDAAGMPGIPGFRSEEHTSELQSLL